MHRNQSLSQRSAQALVGLGLCLVAPTVHAGEVIVDNVNLSNFSSQNNMAAFAGNPDPQLKVFPYDEVYGADYFWSKWDIVRNDDNTFAFRVGASDYLSADEDGGFSLASSVGTNESFALMESDLDSYLIKTWRGTYLSASGNGWANTTQLDTATDDSRWYFLDPLDPATDTIHDSLISSAVNKTVLAGFAGPKVQAFPFEQNYGPFYFWAGWDLIDNGDGTVVFKVGNYYLTVDPITGASNIDTNLTADASFTLVAGDHTSYHLQHTSSGEYLNPKGGGWSVTELDAETSADTRWFFFDPVEIYVEPTFTHGTYSPVNETWASPSFATAFDATPAVFADMQSFAGSDPAGLRLDVYDGLGFDLFVEEEASADAELDHADETIGYFASERGVLRDSNGNPIGEVGTVSADQLDATSWTTLSNLWLSYQNPVVRMTMNSYNGGNPSHIRLRNVGADSLEFQIEEWGYLDGAHGTETIAYMIVEAGTHELADGTLVEAQTLSVDDVFTTASFTQSYSSAPIVLAQCQTENGGDPVVTRVRNLGTGSVQLRLQEEEAKDGTHALETVGVISIGL